MNALAERLRVVLGEERSALAAADLDAIERLLGEKRALVEQLHQNPPPREVMEPLLEKTRQNLAMMHELKSFLGTLAGSVGSISYGSDGRTRTPSSRPRLRGVV